MVAKLLTRIWRGHRPKHPRWRDNKGNFVGWNRFLRNGSRAIATGLLRVAFDKRPVLPWISYDAIEVLKAHLGPKSRVLEFGSGMSTIWYALHAEVVYSVDDYEPWFTKVQDLFKEYHIKNVHYRLAVNRDEYTHFGKQAANSFDLIMVDGSHRAECIENSLDLLAEGGIIYLDNSDFDPDEIGSEFRQAEALLLDFAERNKSEVRYFTDFAPTQFFVQQGMMVKRI